MLGRGWGGRVYEFEYGVAKRVGRLLAASYIKEKWTTFSLKISKPLNCRFESFMYSTSRRCFSDEFKFAFSHPIYKMTDEFVKLRIAHDNKSILFWAYPEEKLLGDQIFRSQNDLWREATNDMIKDF